MKDVLNDMNQMFSNSYKFNVDVSQWNTNGHVDMSNMFLGIFDYRYDPTNGGTSGFKSSLCSGRYLH